MTPQVYVSSRHASFSGKVSGYYGSDPDETSEEWVGILYKNGKEIFRRSNSQLLEVTGIESPEGCLMALLVLYVNK